MAFVKQKGNYENIETGDKIFEPYIIVNSWEKFYFKIHRSSLCRSTDRVGRRDQVLLPLPSLSRTMYRSRRLFLFKKSSARSRRRSSSPQKVFDFSGTP